MLLFGIAGVGVGIDQFDKLRRNPEVTEVACDAEAMQATGTRRWVKLPACEIDFERMFVISRGSRVESVWLPLVADTSTSDTKPVTMLVSKDQRVLALTGQLQGAHDDAAMVAVLRELLPLVTGDGSSGMTETALSSDRVLVARSFPEVDDDYVVLDHGDRPQQSLAFFGTIAGLVLLVMSGVYALLARRKDRADAEALERWHQQQAQYQAQYQYQQPYPPGSWGAPPPS